MSRIEEAQAEERTEQLIEQAGTLVKAQIAVLLHTESPAICMQFMNVQTQAEGYDCGVFAVIFFSMCNTAQLVYVYFYTIYFITVMLTLYRYYT